jgi:hypothetical protein
VAENLGIDVEKGNLTDTGVFVRLLAAHNAETFSTNGLIEALKAVGEAQYSMFIQYSDNQDVFVIRGNRTLFAAESNYGMLINTAAVNLNDLADATKLGLLAFGHEPLEIDKPKDLDDYTLYRLRGAVLEKIKTFEKNVKDINAPKRTVVPWQGTSKRTEDTRGNDGGQCSIEVCDSTEIGARAAAVLKLNRLLPRVTEEHHRLALTELYSGEVPTIHHFESEQLNEYTEMLDWAQEHLDLYNFTEEKYMLWAEFARCVIGVTPEITTEKMYAEAAHTVGKTVDVPYFLNELNVLQNMVQGVAQ